MPKIKLRKKSLTIDDLLELVCDIAYEQSTREISGLDWFRRFITKIEKRQQQIN